MIQKFKFELSVIVRRKNSQKVDCVITKYASTFSNSILSCTARTVFAKGDSVFAYEFGWMLDGKKVFVTAIRVESLHIGKQTVGFLYCEIVANELE